VVYKVHTCLHLFGDRNTHRQHHGNACGDTARSKSDPTVAQSWRMLRPDANRPARNAPSPYDGAALERIALDYVGRYATTKAKLSAYLRRKLRERGWSGEREPPVDALADRLVGFGYVDDGAFAAARTESLLRRGYGARRIAASLRGAGIENDVADALRPRIADGAEAAAWAFARRRRLGPFSTRVQDMAEKRRQVAAMLRAGHDIEVIRRILGTACPEEAVD